MKYIVPIALGAALTACGGAPDPQPEAPTSAPIGHHHHHGQHDPAQHGHAHPASQPSSAPTEKKAHWEPGAEPAGHGHHHHHAFDNPEKWAARWDTAERDAWQKPDAVIGALGVTPAMTFADIGAGTGYFAMRLARAAPEGLVYAIDLEQSMVDYLDARAQSDGLANVKAVRATYTDARIPQPVDMIMLTNTYHHISDRTAYFERVKSSLKPGGRVAIVDYKQVFEGGGPPPEMRLAPDRVVDEMKAAGYAVATRDEETLPRQYILIFTVAE